jgi:hypothetical protein
MIHPHSGGVSNLASVEQLTERILYRLSLDMRVRALAERLLHRFAETVGDLPASEKHHHSESGGLYRHSLEVALNALDEFEGDMISERRPDGSVDSFRSAHNRPRWQYATFIAALCHDLGKLFDLEVRGKGDTWCPMHERYCEFGRRTKAPVACWRPDREHGSHALASVALLHHVLSCEDEAYLGAPRLSHLFSCLSEGHDKATTSLLSKLVSRGDQASVEREQPAIAAQPDSKIGLLLQTWQELIRSGEMGINIPGAQVYADGERTAVVVPVAVTMARDRLKDRQIVLPPNTNLYNMLRSAGLAESDAKGLSVRDIKVQGKHGPISLSALIFPTEKVVPKDILPTLVATHFEIEIEPEPEAVTVGKE